MHYNHLRKKTGKGSVRKRGGLPGDDPGLDSAAWEQNYLFRMLAAGYDDCELLAHFVQRLSPEYYRQLTGRLELKGGIEDEDLFDRRRHRSRPDWTRAEEIPQRQLVRDMDELDDPDSYLSGGTAAVADALLALMEQEQSVLQQGLERNSALVTGLQELFQLHPDETDMLVLCYTAEVQSEFGRFIQRRDDLENHRLMAVALGLSVGRVRTLLGSRSRLVMSGLLEGHRNFNSIPSVAAEAVEHLSGVGDVPLQDQFVRRVEGDGFSLRSFGISAERIRLMKGLLAQDGAAGARVLFYGKPGTGKSELARALVRSCGRPAFLLATAEDGNFRRRNRRLGLELALERARRENGVLIIDEADELLNTEPTGLFAGLFRGDSQDGDKGWLNELLDRSAVPMIWITNRVNGMHSSVQRRFSYSLEFRDNDLRRRTEVWKQALAASPLHTLIPVPLLKQLAAEYPVNTGGVTKALAEVSRLLDAASGEQQVEELLRELLDRQLALSGIRRSAGFSLQKKNYDPSVLRLDCSPEALLESVRKFGAFLDRSGSGVRRSLNLLFWGPSGTGKTAYARYLAEATGRELLVMRPSDLLDPYVGMTEKKIARAFRQAEEEDKLLFIDEADSFLYSRSGAQRGWELSHVNEFLSRMETFRGILICCTNLLDRFDYAALRRFQWKAGFKPLDRSGRERLYRKYFQPAGRLPVEVVQQLSRLEGLVPGDFSAVEQRYGFYPEAERGHAQLLDALAVELHHRSGRREIGFS